MTPERQVHALYTWWPHALPHYKKNLVGLAYISLKPTNEIRFLSQIKVSIKHYRPIIYLCVTYFVTSLTMSDT